MDRSHTAPESLSAKAQPQMHFLINMNCLCWETLKGKVRERALPAPISLNFLCYGASSIAWLGQIYIPFVLSYEVQNFN